MLIIPLDHKFLVQQVFALCNCDSFLVCFFLIFEVVKLCKMNLKSPYTSFQTTYLFTLGPYQMKNAIKLVGTVFPFISWAKQSTRELRPNWWVLNKTFLHSILLVHFVTLHSSRETLPYVRPCANLETFL